MTKRSAGAGGHRPPPPRRFRTSPTEKKPYRWLNRLIILLVLAGSGMMLYPVLSNLYFNWQAQNEIHTYYEYLDVDCDALFAQAEAYNQELLQPENQFNISQEEQERISTLLNPLGNGMMGYIEISKIDVRLPIYQGTEESSLQAGAGWWYGSSLPTGGASTHCILTAHTGLVRAKMFTDLDQLVEGDTFTLSILDRTLTYEVDQILVVEPSEIDPLRIVEGQDYVTLYTCTPYGVNSHRLLVRGHRVETPEAEPEQPASLWRTVGPLLLGMALAVAAVLLIWAIRAWRQPGKRVAHKEKNVIKRGDS